MKQRLVVSIAFRANFWQYALVVQETGPDIWNGKCKTAHDFQMIYSRYLSPISLNLLLLHIVDDTDLIFLLFFFYIV
jgi:hypothetical protein